jgi:hypothetical protein
VTVSTAARSAPRAEQLADLEKIADVRERHGVIAARRMFAALGLPTIPVGLCEPAAVEARDKCPGPSRN